MRISKILGSIVPRIAAIVLALLVAEGILSFSQPTLTGVTFKESSVLAAAPQEEAGSVHIPLASVGVTRGQTARINVVNSPDPASSDPPTPITVEMCYHDINGDEILDRSGRPVEKTVTIDPHHGDFLDLNGNLVAAPGRRFVIVPSVRILRISPGTLAMPTFELYNNLLKTTFVLSPGTARGFEPQPDPALSQDLAFSLVGITPGETARLYVLNAMNPDALVPAEPITVEMEFNDVNGHTILDRTGRPAQKIVTLNPTQADFLELNGNDIAAPGSRVGIITCVKVLRGSRSSLVTPTFEIYVNFTQQTLLLSNFVNFLNSPVTPR